jgi:beta-galactosidase
MNCESVELRLNGKRFGTRRSGDFMNSAIIWHVPYEAGELRAIGRNGDRIVARHRLRTSGTPVRVILQVDHRTVVADGHDAAHVVAMLMDRRGERVCTADRLIQFHISGPGRLLGVDNGDLRDLTRYSSSRRHSRQGRCLGIVRATGLPGAISIRAGATGLEPASCRIVARPPQKFR